MEHRKPRREILTRAQKDILWDRERKERREKEKRWAEDRETCHCKEPLLIRKYGLSWLCARCSGWREPG